MKVVGIADFGKSFVKLDDSSAPQVRSAGMAIEATASIAESAIAPRQKRASGPIEHLQMHERSLLLLIDAKPAKARPRRNDMKYYPLNEDAARSAYRMNHFGEFRSDEPDYRASVDNAYALAMKVSRQTPAKARQANELADRYARKLADWYNKKYRIDAMCPSVLIAGPANFPVRKKEKQNRAWDNLYKEYSEIQNILDRIERLEYAPDIIKSGDDDAIERLEEKIEKLTAHQEAMKAANAQARKENKSAPYASYTLSNNNKKIRDAKARLANLKAAKEQGTTEREVEFMGESMSVIENTDLMRLQLVFDGKPGDDVRAALKKNGFRWSPKNGAWQRQLTNNARFALKCMLKLSVA